MRVTDAELLETIYQATIDLEALGLDSSLANFDKEPQIRRAAGTLHNARCELELRVIGRRARGLVSALGRRRDARGRFVSRARPKPSPPEAAREDERDEWVDQWIMAAGRQ